MILRDVEVDEEIVDVRVSDGTITEVAPALAGVGHGHDEDVVDGRGGALLPGLHDHHVHLNAMAAARISVDCSGGIEALADADGERVRGIGFKDSVDRTVLDRYEPVRPTRIQHRSGGLWMLNSAALAELEPLPDLPGVERDRNGQPTGRLWRLDEMLRGSWDTSGDLPGVARELAAYGVTGVTDATPELTKRPAVPQRVTLLGRRKILLHDHALPGFDDLSALVRDLHDAGLPVAVHCVTRESLLLTLAVLDDVGRRAGDRIEHGAIVPEPRALSGLTVVTQPGFVTDRGADYERSVDPRDLDHLYPYASLLQAGVDVVPSSDAPFGPADPWGVIRSAVSRDLAPSERVDARTALAGFLRDADLRPRRVEVGAPADLVLLEVPLADALDQPSASVVRGTWIAGRPVATAG